MINDDNLSISIRFIQHYLYCPHRWGLLEVDKAWAENVFITKGNLLHKRVHESNNYTSRGRNTFSSVQVFNDNEEYNIFGVVDCLEAVPTKTGINLFNDGKKYNLTIVEYKPTKPKQKEYNEEDLMQVFAQKICVDYVFKTDCECILYYADVKKRITLPVKDDFKVLNHKLKSVLEVIRQNLKCGIIPMKEKNQKCSGCSLINICLPKESSSLSLRQRLLEDDGIE